MDLTDYKIGTNLQLDIYDDIGQAIDRDFASKFEEPIDAYEAYIAVPIVEGVIYAVRVGWKITVYMREGNDFYRFFARVMERTYVDGRALLRIMRLSEIDVAQRRQYYRFKCAIPFRYRLIGDGSDRRILNMPFLNGTTADLSGSGMCFNASAELKVHSLIECELSIDRRQVFVIGKIARCIRKPDEESGSMFKYEVGILFSEIERRNREFIFRFIFDEERRQLSKRMED
ncbi:MAG: flagellar brake protein [Clostridiales bacterium]|jgi:c-di-GMP-binding flagellar brake protein YcgR|nr:flagellar brake protein [Clostridiales bacterium]